MWQTCRRFRKPANLIGWLSRTRSKTHIIANDKYLHQGQFVTTRRHEVLHVLTDIERACLVELIAIPSMVPLLGQIRAAIIRASLNS